MKLVYTEQAIASLQECMDFFPPEVPSEKVNEIRDRILAKADKLLVNPYIGQQEEYLEHMGQSHRRVIEGNYKIIYKVEGDAIFITDIFDSRQDPEKMKG
ncbi:MAG: type II toxin-antitoxin system RelE/ParE family toxin [Cytophagales bacterium]|jgi:toxin ParE1/3/4|nr:type II toxin-antitoxin system RelE/ParE family toxin [Microcystis sp. M112S1]MCA4900296.1 type II toxin-antitoxin system RelE/ParE family toxin [Cytophagales bacterium]MCA6366214.1 type II toxin-antitoxin system RelE/ParE family toxin [Cytophagales bacterium]MCA6372850.1 type II toxin-antitoxin system RelE/ParE family toxin [Cytophagales bacterium]MCA6385868.1 type II toxin-antitoxin system RelE/ParE family toxin [Cytophagales bacterium]